MAWREFKRGKRKKKDVQEFEFNLEDNLFALHEALAAKTYEHSAYESFYVQDPKLRHIHKACVRDRVVHQAVFRILYPIFDAGFIFDSYSCRTGKGTHRAVLRLEMFMRKLSKNYKKPIFALKCDVKKFFDSIDQQILLCLIRNRVRNENMLWLIERIIESFEKERNTGLPLGNVTSQIFANIYLNELDYFVKHALKVKHYIRYCDDFVILSEERKYLEATLSKINNFLIDVLKLSLHGRKIIFRKFTHGIDFLGYVVMPYYRVLRTKTKRRILKKMARRKSELERGEVDVASFNSSLQSYFGVLAHCKGFKIRKKLIDTI